MTNTMILDFGDTVTVNGVTYVRCNGGPGDAAALPALGPRAKAHTHWKKEDDGTVLALADQGYSNAAIAKKMGRTKNAVQVRVSLLRSKKPAEAKP